MKINLIIKRTLISLLVIFSLISGLVPFYLKDITTKPILAANDYNWTYTKGSWYLLDSYGDYYHGWYYENGTNYYLNETTGEMKTGWLYYYGSWYYFDNDGSMRTGWLYYDDDFYYMNTSGEMHTEWLYFNGDWYYFNYDGSMHTEWLFDGYSWYYFYPISGIMASDIVIDGYYINSDGIWIH